MSRNAGGKRERECPKCRDRLFERKLKDSRLKVDVCPTCHGMWFDNRELEAALDLKAPERFVPHDAPRSDRRCPECRVSMSRFSYLKPTSRSTCAEAATVTCVRRHARCCRSNRMGCRGDLRRVLLDVGPEVDLHWQDSWCRSRAVASRDFYG